MSRVGSTYVPAEGNKRAKIMVVGEAPGADEVSQGRPFIGRSGELLTRYLGRHRVRRDEVYLTNLCKYQPFKNKFTNLFDGGWEPCDELAAGLEELRDDIVEVDPNIIIATGNWPMWFLTGATGSKGGPGTGITQWRGSVVPNTFVDGGPKVLITYHPAYIVRPEGFAYNPIFHFDLGKAIREASSREILIPQYDSFIDPGEGQLELLIREFEKAKQISTDIETFGDKLACVGFACSREWGLCLTHNAASRSWPASQYLLSLAVPKVFQFGTYDINYLDRYYNWIVNGYGYVDGQLVGWDTYIAAATLMPEFPRGLDFLASIYTHFPFYKEERKIWKETGDQTTLWEYNIKDVIATLMIAEEQQREIANSNW